MEPAGAESATRRAVEYELLASPTVDAVDTSDWAGLIAGERESLARLYDRHAAALLRYGRGYTDDDACADALHALFVRLWERRSRLPPDAHPRAYLLVSLRNELLRDMREQARVVAESPPGRDEIADASADPEFAIVAAEIDLARAERLQAALATLSPRERELVSLRFYQGLDYAAIADVTGISYQSARNVLARALAKLRERLPTILWLALGTKGVAATLLLEQATELPL